MKHRHWKILGTTVMLIIFTGISLMMYSYSISLILMRDEITFSSSVFIGFFSSPLLIYVLSGSVFFFIFDRLPKYNKITINYLAKLALASILFSLPVSLYVNYKLKHDGYLTCDKISWMSPTTYVKDLSLCK
jgi:predicted permease